MRTIKRQVCLGEREAGNGDVEFQVDERLQFQGKQLVGAPNNLQSDNAALLKRNSIPLRRETYSPKDSRVPVHANPFPQDAAQFPAKGNTFPHNCNAIPRNGNVSLPVAAESFVM